MERCSRSGMGLSLVGMLTFAMAGEVSAKNDGHKPAERHPGGKNSGPARKGTVKAIDKIRWGELDGKEVDLYTLTNAHGLMAKITNYGGILTELHVPDKEGRLDDIVGGLDSLDDYTKKSPYFGATVGRVGNRIAGAQFDLDGKTYKLANNNDGASLHGGKKGWDKVVWTAEPRETATGPALTLTYLSKDGEEGYPGNVTATTIYTLTNDNELTVEMEATTDKATPVNMVHHTYWNLHGDAWGSIEDLEATIYADNYTPGKPMIPDGTVRLVAGTPFDFREPKPIGKDLNAAAGTPIGFDSNWIVNGEPNALRQVARFRDPKSGRVMTIKANQPGVQFYSGNFMDGQMKGKGHVYSRHSAFCVETQKFPNSINIPAWKNAVILRPGQVYKHVMIHKFTAE